MSSSYEKSVKGGTKVKLAPPKSKYVEHILQATKAGEAGVAEVFRTLTHRLRDATWTVAFKSLIIVHLMIKEGVRDVTLSWLSVAPRNKLAINQFTDVQTQGHNIRRYSEYLLARAEAFAAGKCDYVRSGETRAKSMSVEKGLLRDVETVQRQISALVKCDFMSDDTENEITLTAYRMVTRDLLDLYNVENEGVMSVLNHYFEMPRSDAERAIKIYKRFCKQTDDVVQYLSVARQYESATRLQIPKVKHAPTGLAKSLQEYLDDTDFEVNRRQYLAQQEAKRTGRPIEQPVQSKPQPIASSTAPVARAAEPTPVAQPPKGPPPDLIDFFESIEQNQQPMAQNAPQYQQQPPGYGQPQQQQFGYQQMPQQTGFQQGQPPAPNGFQQNGTNPFLQMQQQQQQPQIQQQPPQMPQQQQPQPLNTQFTGAGFGGYGPQPQQQFAGASGFGQEQQQAYGSPVSMQSPQQPQQQQTNPFRQSMMPTGTPPMSFDTTGAQPLQRQGTNPFARNAGTPPVANSPFTQQSPSPFPPQQQQQQQPQPMQPQQTGTNPFARNITPSQQQPPMPNALQMQPTGSTNPFRQSAFVNQQTGAGWQHGPQATMGGLEGLDTISVFPQPGQANIPQQQQQQQSPWG